MLGGRPTQPAAQRDCRQRGQADSFIRKPATLPAGRGGRQPRPRAVVASRLFVCRATFSDATRAGGVGGESTTELWCSGAPRRRVGAWVSQQSTRHVSRQAGVGCRRRPRGVPRQSVAAQPTQICGRRPHLPRLPARSARDCVSAAAAAGDGATGRQTRAVTTGGGGIVTCGGSEAAGATSVPAAHTFVGWGGDLEGRVPMVGPPT